MTSVRAQLAQLIVNEAALQNFPMDVKPFGVQPEELRKPVVAVFRGELDQGDNHLKHGFTLQIMHPGGYAGEDTEDALDGALDVVLKALGKSSVVSFSKAKRQVFLELFQGWEIDAEWLSKDFY